VLVRPTDKGKLQKRLSVGKRIRKSDTKWTVFAWSGGKNVGIYRPGSRTSVFGFRPLKLKSGGVLRTAQTAFMLVILKVYCINMTSQAFQEAQFLTL
jgi:hypothetical protein